jgi:hypothetical protein
VDLVLDHIFNTIGIIFWFYSQKAVSHDSSETKNPAEAGFLI